MALQGLTDLYGQHAAGRTDAGALESQGTTADPSHGVWGDTSAPAWMTGPYPSHGQFAYEPDWVMVGEDPLIQPVGDRPHDLTPDSHAAPYPRMRYPGGELRNAEEQWADQEASWILHAEDQGGNWYNESPGGRAVPVHWDQRLTVTEGSTILEPVPGQLRGGDIGQDVAQGYGTSERFGYGGGHVQYRQQTDPVPYNYQWLQAGERPFIVPQPHVQPTYDGPDSPYGPHGDTTSGMHLGVQGAVEGRATDTPSTPENPITQSDYSPAQAAMIGQEWF